MKIERDFLCYVYGHDAQWSAICVDLDLAVEAKSQNEAMACLESMLDSYVEDALKEEPRTCAKLLRRRSPVWLRLSLWVAFQVYLFRRSGPHSKSYSTIAVPCRA